MTRKHRSSKHSQGDISRKFEGRFYRNLIIIAVVGTFLSFFIPQFIPPIFFGPQVEGPVRAAVISQLILLSSVFLLMLLTIGENRQKYIRKQNIEDYMRLVRAERRIRHTEAVKQLSDKSQSIRLASIYTLINLVDEWLIDDNLSAEEQTQEGQTIINDICAYICSPFSQTFEVEGCEADVDTSAYAGDFITDQALFRNEQEIRRTIFAEISKRSSTLLKDESGEGSVIPGAWSRFTFDFKRAAIFYPLDGLNIENTVFSAAKFYDEAVFHRTTFIGNIDFNHATFEDTAVFDYATFTGDVNFSTAVFKRAARFRNTIFVESSDFSGARFNGDVFFSWGTFKAKTDFRDTYFSGHAEFHGVAFITDVGFSRASFIKRTSFFRTYFGGNTSFFKVVFTGDTDFLEATFKKQAGFNNASFWRGANFSRTRFEGLAGFRHTTFKESVAFTGATFIKNTDFCNASFIGQPPIFVDENKEAGMIRRAQFAALPLSDSQEAGNFKVNRTSIPIPLDTAELNSIIYHIPVGTVLFDPDSWDEQNKEYTRVSAPAGR